MYCKGVVPGVQCTPGTTPAQHNPFHHHSVIPPPFRLYSGHLKSHQIPREAICSNSRWNLTRRPRSGHEEPFSFFKFACLLPWPSPTNALLAKSHEIPRGGLDRERAPRKSLNLTKSPLPREEPSSRDFVGFQFFKFPAVSRCLQCKVFLYCTRDTRVKLVWSKLDVPPRF